MKFTLEEFLPIYSQELKDKDQGVYEDFLECLMLYDKQEVGTMLGAELSHMLISLGERLDETQVNEVLADCLFVLQTHLKKTDLCLSMAVCLSSIQHIHTH
uniref:Myosin light chain alkali n=1 Tax=Cacopsylla melanoneura TaxID=428564 RepID=A0A8D9DYI8_9HEMI